MDELVSVIMPCYNDGLFLQESIQSVYAQTYGSIELIVVDDGSSDIYTMQILKELEKSAKCRVIHTEHVGLAQARNSGIAAAKGKYILPLDSDDLIDQTYIAKSVRIMQEHPQVGIVYCRADLFGENSGPWDLPPYSFEKMLQENIIFVTSLFYKSDWVAVGGFNPNMIYGMEDYDFFIGLLSLGREVYQIPETLFHYRIKKKSMTSLLKDDMTRVKAMYAQLYDNHPEFYQKHHDVYARVLREALIEQIFLCKAIVQKNELYARLKKIPLIRALIKRIVR